MKKIIFLSILLFPVLAFAIPVSFQWTASTGDVAGYRLYTKYPNGTYTKLGNDIVGRNTTTVIANIDEPIGTGTFTVVARAYDAVGNESADSNEATKDGTTFVWKDITPPPPPGLLQVLDRIASALEKISNSVSTR